MTFHASAVMAVLRVPTVGIWLAPFFLAPVFWLASISPLAWLFDKAHQETFAVLVLVANLIVILIAYLGNRGFATLWMLLFGVVLFFRELHFVGTNNGFYVACVLLAWWASRNRDTFAREMHRLRVDRLLAAAVWIYLMSKTMDRHYWRFVPQYDQWHDYVEESLESMGHIVILVASIAVVSAGRIPRPSEAVNRNAASD